MAFKKIIKLFPKNKKFELDLSIYKNSLPFSFTTKKKHRCILLIGGYRNISYLWNVFKNKLNSHDVYYYAPKTHSKGKSYFQYSSYKDWILTYFEALCMLQYQYENVDIIIIIYSLYVRKK